MYRRKLVLRRFGEMSFGLGYVEDGVWVDHAAVARSLAAEEMTESERAALDAIHSWFGCCNEGVPAVVSPEVGTQRLVSREAAEAARSASS